MKGHKKCQLLAHFTPVWTHLLCLRNDDVGDDNDNEISSKSVTKKSREAAGE